MKGYLDAAVKKCTLESWVEVFTSGWTTDTILVLSWHKTRWLECYIEMKADDEDVLETRQSISWLRDVQTATADSNTGAGQSVVIYSTFTRGGPPLHASRNHSPAARLACDLVVLHLSPPPTLVTVT